MTVTMLSSCGGGASKEVTIGNQVWMTENLNVDKFRNGDPIPEAKTDEEWEKAGENKQPAWCYYDNDTVNGSKLGKLYNWYAVSDSRGLAPVGYHIPSNEEWTMLSEYLGGELKAGVKMKSKSGWYDNGIFNNGSGFSGVPGGVRGVHKFSSIGGYGCWWSSTKCGTNSVWFRALLSEGDPHNASPPDALITGCDYAKTGTSVRCLRD